MLREKHLHHNSWDQPASCVKPVAVQVRFLIHRPKNTHILEPRADRFTLLASNRAAFQHINCFFRAFRTSPPKRTAWAGSRGICLELQPHELVPAAI